jgi:NTP pyrophosphatase (non-canonical NTP hydrolase)
MANTEFVKIWDDTAKEVHDTAVEKGWWDRFIKTDGCKNGPHKYYLDKHNNNPFLRCSLCDSIKEGAEAFELIWDAATRRNDGELLALITSEISEALEGLRKGNPPNDQLPEYSYAEVELADVVIRLMDMAAARDWKVGEVVMKKMEFNKSRAYRHGGKSF